MQHAQVLYKVPSVPAKMEFNVLRYEHYDGTYVVSSDPDSGTGL